MNKISKLRLGLSKKFAFLLGTAATMLLVACGDSTIESSRDPNAVTVNVVVRSTEGAVLTGATVTHLSANGEESAEQTTNASGVASFQIQGGVHSFRVARENFASVIITNAELLAESRDGLNNERVLPVALIPANAEFRGRIFRIDPANPQRRDIAAVGAEVRVTISNNPQLAQQVYTTKTDENGNFAFTNLPAVGTSYQAVIETFTATRTVGEGEDAREEVIATFMGGDIFDGANPPLRSGEPVIITEPIVLDETTALFHFETVSSNASTVTLAFSENIDLIRGNPVSINLGARNDDVNFAENKKVNVTINNNTMTITKAAGNWTVDTFTVNIARVTEGDNIGYVRSVTGQRLAPVNVRVRVTSIADNFALLGDRERMIDSTRNDDKIGTRLINTITLHLTEEVNRDVMNNGNISELVTVAPHQLLDASLSTDGRTITVRPFSHVRPNPDNSNTDDIEAARRNWELHDGGIHDGTFSLTLAPTLRSINGRTITPATVRVTPKQIDISKDTVKLVPATTDGVTNRRIFAVDDFVLGNIEGTDKRNDTIIRWTPVKHATHYDIYWREPGENSYVLIRTINAVVDGKSVDSVDVGINYTFGVASKPTLAGGQNRYNVIARNRVSRTVPSEDRVIITTPVLAGAEKLWWTNDNPFLFRTSNDWKLQSALQGKEAVPATEFDWIVINFNEPMNRTVHITPTSANNRVIWESRWSNNNTRLELRPRVTTADEGLATSPAINVVIGRAANPDTDPATPESLLRSVAGTNLRYQFERWNDDESKMEWITNNTGILRVRVMNAF